VRRELDKGCNFVRPAAIELAAAERFLETVPTAEMVKFAKNGSDATTAAVRLARAATGRTLVAICRDHPFFSTDDWFIGVTPMSAGIPDQPTVSFPYGDLDALAALLAQHAGEIACVILEHATHTESPPGYLTGVRELTTRHGAVLVFDEKITGFRWSEHRAQGVYGVTRPVHLRQGPRQGLRRLRPRREMRTDERGGLRSEHEPVFLPSTTHGAETHSLAVVDTYAEMGIAARLPALGEGCRGVRKATASAGVADPSNPCPPIRVTDMPRS